MRRKPYGELPTVAVEPLIPSSFQDSSIKPISKHNFYQFIYVPLYISTGYQQTTWNVTRPSGPVDYFDLSPLGMKWAIQPSFSALSSSGIFPLYFSVLVVFKLTFGGSDLRSKTSLTSDNSELGCHRLDLSLNKRQGVSSQFDSKWENGGYMPQNFLTPCFI